MLHSVSGATDHPGIGPGPALGPGILLRLPSPVKIPGSLCVRIRRRIAIVISNHGSETFERRKIGPYL